MECKVRTETEGEYIIIEYRFRVKPPEK